MTSPWSILGLLALAHILAVATPGPNNALVFQVAARSRRDAVTAAVGIWPAGVIWAFLGLAGVGAVVEATPRLAIAMRLAGGLYLCWLGYRIIFAARRRAQAGAEAGATKSAGDSGFRLFALGFATNFLNPKGIAYYTSIFAAVGAYELDAGFRAAAVLGMPTIGLLWYLGVATIVSSAPGQRVFSRAGRFVDLAAGSIMILFGLHLLASATILA